MEEATRNCSKRRPLRQVAKNLSPVRSGQMVAFDGSKPLRSGRQERAAVALAQALLPETHLAVVLGASRRTLYRWRQDPAFMARVEYFQSQIAAAELTRCIEEARSRAEQQDPAVRAFYAPAAAREALGATSSDSEQVPRNEITRPPRTAYVESPEPAPKSIWDVLLRPQRECMLLNSDPLHSSWRGH